MKGFLRSRPVQWLLSYLVFAYMRLVQRTTRWTLAGDDRMAALWASRRGAVACMWHRGVMQAVVGWPDGAQPRRMVISASPDGQFVADATERLGVGVIRGSTRKAAKRDKKKGGEGAYRAMIAHVESGGVVGMTPDGPRGPRMRASMGAVRLAKAAQAPLCPYAWSVRRRKVLDTWDRFVFPFPFSKGAIVWAEPIDPPAEDAEPAEMEAVRAKLEAALNEIAAEADRIAGVEPEAPA